MGGGDPTDDLDMALDRAFRRPAEPGEAGGGGASSADVRGTNAGAMSSDGPPSGAFPRVSRVPLTSGVISRLPPGTSIAFPAVAPPQPSGLFARPPSSGGLLTEDAASLAEALTVGVVVSDARGIVRDSNAAARRIFGVAQDALFGTRLLDLFEDSGRPTIETLLQDVLRGRAAHDVDLVALSRQGPVAARVAAAGRFDGDHRLREVVWSVRESGPQDPSKEIRGLDSKAEALAELGLELGREVGPAIVRLTEALVTAQKLAGEASAMPGAAAGADLLGARLSEAMSGLLRLQQVVTELERFAVASPLTVQPVDPAAILARAETLLSRSLKARRIHVRNEMDDPAPRVLADAGRLAEIFVNLLRNARNALANRFDGADPDATLRQKRLIVFESFVKGPYTVIVVTNNGVPVAASDVEKIFLPGFAQRDPSRPGIGLAESAALIRSMGGAIRCQSLGNEGTRFLLTFRKADT